MFNTVKGPQRSQVSGSDAFTTGSSQRDQGTTRSPIQKQNRFAIVAFVAAIFGAILAVWQGAQPAGWFLLPVAFVLSLVALSRRGKPKKMAVAALIISIAGAIAGAWMFTGSAVIGLDEAIDTGTTISEPAQAENDDVQAGVSGEKGTRENPVAIGTAVSSDEWEVTVNSFTADATDTVIAEDASNAEPGDGEVYALINLSVKRISEEPAYPTEVGASYVAEDGNIFSSFDARVVLPEDLSKANELSKGDEASGDVAVMIPKGGAGSILISPGTLADDVFFATGAY